MRMRIQAVVEAEPGDTPIVHEIATLERGPLQPDGLNEGTETIRGEVAGKLLA